MKNTNKNTIDVILCCYNQEKYIAQAVESIISQKVDAQVQVIVADDCSTDKTLEIIRSYEKQSPFPFVYLTEDHNVGLSANYKRAFAACSAEYTAILEGDDWWCEPWHLSQQFQFLQKKKQYSMSFNYFGRYYQDEERCDASQWPYRGVNHIKIKLRHQLAWGNQIGNLSACMFRTRLLKLLPDELFLTDFADWDLGVLMALHGPIGLLHGRTSMYRVNNQGLWSALSADEKNESMNNTIQSLEPMLPKCCDKYIKEYYQLQEKGITSLYPIPFNYRMRSAIRRLCRIGQ